LFCLDPIPEPIVDESDKAGENDDAPKDDFDTSLPPELRKLMEQAKQREEAENQANKDDGLTDRSNTQANSEGVQDGKELTQTSLTDKGSNKDEKSFNGNRSIANISFE